MAKVKHIATVDGRPISSYDEGKQEIYSSPTLKQSVEILNQKFIDLKKQGEIVTRTSVSEFIHFKN